MILAFHVPPFYGAGSMIVRIFDIDSLYSRKIQTISTIGKSCHGEIGPIILFFTFWPHFSEFFWTINYRFHLTPSVQLVEAHEMSKSLNLTKIKCSLFVGTSGMFFLIPHFWWKYAFLMVKLGRKWQDYCLLLVWP